MFSRLREDIAVVFDRDPAARTRWEVLTCYPGCTRLVWHRWVIASAVAARAALARPLARPLGPLADRDRDPSGRGRSGAGCSSITDGHRDRRNGRNRRRLHALSRRDAWAGRHGRRASATPRWARGVVIGAGAKILGPILVGDGAKIGCKCRRSARRSCRSDRRRHPRPDPDRATTQQRRESHAAKMGFSAYAIAADMNDPMVQAIHRLIDHAGGDRRAAAESSSPACRQAASTAATPRRRLEDSIPSGSAK